MPDRGLSIRQRSVKRCVDVVVAAAGLVVFSPVLAVALAAARLDTGQSGLFTQQRVGRHGKLFSVHKIRTMRPLDGHASTVTASNDARITRLGAVLRKTKIDELPQLFDVLVGTMSLVGPRPDVPGYADVLTGDDRLMLTVRPGITGPAALAYRHEEELLAAADDPVVYNDTVIWPDKVKINCDYVRQYSLRGDLQIIRDTLATTLVSTK